MLKKKVIGLLLLFLCQVALPIWAQQRNSSQILEIANKYFTNSGRVSSKASSSSLNVIPASRVLKPLTRAAGPSGESFYIVESSGNFVIISGDERMKSILGYSDQKPADFSNLPENIRAWLNIYAKEYAYLQENPSLSSFPEKSSIETGLPASVAPLLNIAWAQESPYNDLCPVANGKRAVTGCVATAMAQVMKYYEYPAKGTGRSSYLNRSEEFSVYVDLNLEQEPLEWKKMSSTNYSERNHAIAWLMACCGAAIETTYGSLLSSASPRRAAQVLVKNFGYDEGIHNYMRDNYTYADFLAIIKEELSTNRPIIADAFDETVAGHCFVFDGYNKDDLIHVNWGWGGGMDGYYELTSMHPGFHGPGSTTGGFNVGLNIMTGIQKPIDNQSYISHFSGLGEMSLQGPTSIARTGTFTISPGMCMNQTSSFTGNIQPCLFQNGKFVTTLGSPAKVENLAYTQGFSQNFENVSIPTTVKEGDYQLYVATKDNRETDWQIIDMQANWLPYYKVKITASKVDFTNPVNKKGLKLISLKQEHNLYQNLGTHFFLTVQNDYTEWYGRVGVQIKSVERPNEAPIVIAQERAVFGVGQKTFELVNEIIQNVSVGNYYLQPVFSEGGVIWEPLGTFEQKIITVSPKPGNEFKLEIESVNIERASLTEKDTLKCIVKVKNTGKDPYDGKIGMQLNKNYYPGSEYTQKAFLDPGQSAVFQLTGNKTVPDGDYNINFFYYWPWSGNVSLKGQSYECSIRSLGGSKK